MTSAHPTPLPENSPRSRRSPSDQWVGSSDPGNPNGQGLPRSPGASNGVRRPGVRKLTNAPETHRLT